ncbi:MAG: DUF1801 domain-containing protein [Rhodovibrionaceae bacterium]
MSSPEARPLAPEVEPIFAAYPPAVRARLLALRRLILETAAATPGVGPLQETLKWGQPSYLTAESRSGSTVRIDRAKDEPGRPKDRIAVYFHCGSGLVESFRELYPRELTYAGRRAILFAPEEDVQEAPLCHCLALALTHHLRKRKGAA